MCLIKTLAFTDPLKVWGALGQLVSSMNHKQKSAQGFWKSFGFHDPTPQPFCFGLGLGAQKTCLKGWPGHCSKWGQGEKLSW